MDHLSCNALRLRLERAHRLLCTAYVLAAELDPADVVKAILRESRTVVGCDRASLFIHDGERRELSGVVTTDPEGAEAVSDVDQAIANYVARYRESVNIADLSQDDRFASSIGSVADGKPGYFLAAPLLAPRDESLLGVLQLHKSEGEPFDHFERLLFGSYCQHASVAIDRVGRVEALNRQRSVQASLQVAREIQQGFMPSRMPSISGYEAATWWMANEAVGGDYCDVIPLKNQHVALAIADVSGHGVGPSLIMATVRAALHALTLEHTEPEVLLNLLARSLSRDLSSERFITMALGVLDPFDHSIQYANAGHAPALHFEAATGEFMPLESTGMPLGVVDRPSYHQGWPLTLELGDLVVFCTDGVVEAFDRHDRPFGRRRLEAIVGDAASLPVAQIVSRLGEAVQDHYGGGSPPDDLTILILRRNA